MDTITPRGRRNTAYAGCSIFVATVARSYVLLLCRVLFGIIKLFHGHFVYLRFQLFEIV